jgi:hypothetical protein
MTEPIEPTDPADSIDGAVLQAMRQHDRLAPDGAALAEQVLTQVHGGRSVRPRRMPATVTAGLAAASVVAILATSYAIARGIDSDRDRDLSGPADSLSASPSAPASNKPSNTNPSDAAVLDPLTYRLALGEPQEDGTIASTITVTNRSDELVTDPNCLHNANYSFGVVPVDRPGATLDGRVETKCAGARELPAGFYATFEGPTFSIRGLQAGAYIATIDFGDARSERLMTRLTAP